MSYPFASVGTHEHDEREIAFFAMRGGGMERSGDDG